MGREAPGQQEENDGDGAGTSDAAELARHGSSLLPDVFTA
jgi:hypothetical protein